jgi:peptidyl-prolyl cis-trans isomerase C
MNTPVSQLQANLPEALPAITVDGIAIDENDLANELQYHRHSDFTQVVQQAGQALVIRALLLQQADINNLDISSEHEEASIQKLFDDNVFFDEPDEVDCRRYFDNNPEKFMSMPLMEVEHILVAAPKDDPAARAEAAVMARDMIARLQVDPLLFPVLAEQYSACPSKKEGGSLGSISKGQTVPEFERQLMYLSSGLAAKAIETRYGFHVVNVVHRVDGKPLEYPVVADRVKNYLSHRASRLAVQVYIQGLVEAADIDGIEIRFLDGNVYI